MPGYERSIRILGSDGNPLWISSKGDISVELRGMSEGSVSTMVSIGPAPTKLPPQALDGRKSIAIFVPDFSGTFYIGGPALTEDNGFPLPNDAYFFIDAESDIFGYATEIVDIRILESA